MFGKIFRILSLAVALGIGAPLLAQAGMYGRHAGSITPSMMGGHSLSAADATLTVDEATVLVFMREEEKLARDLYLSFDEQFGGTTFAQIASSEQRHMDAILRKLTRYQLPDPAAGNAIGEFSDDELQALYDDLLEEGTASGRRGDPGRPAAGLRGADLRLAQPPAGLRRPHRHADRAALRRAVPDAGRGRRDPAAGLRAMRMALNRGLTRAG
jgi:hypothetical protein